MIEIITEDVVMPKIGKRRFQLNCDNPNTVKQDKWSVTDTQSNSTGCKGSFEMAAIACHNLNKKYYLEKGN